MADDDVLFKNSVLYEHLRKLGYDDGDLSAEEADTPNKTSTEQVQDNEQNDEKSENWRTQVSSVLADFIWDTQHRKEINQLHQKEAEGLVDLILDCPLLEEEDAAYIDSFSSSLQAMQQLPPNNESDSIMTQIIMQMGLLGIVMAYGCLRLSVMKVESGSASQLMMYSLDVISVLLLVAALLPSTIRFTWAGHILRKMKKFQRKVVTLHQDICLWHKMTKRGIRLIQEMELVHRGFTFVSDQTPVMRIEGTTDQRQCPKLRQQIFMSAKLILIEFKAATSKLLQQFPSHVELEGVSNYLANQPLTDYGPCLNAETTEDMYKASDGFCLGAVKAMVELCNTHISEFLRVLSLACLLREENVIIFGFTRQQEMMTDVWSSLHKHYIPLHRLYLLHKHLSSDKPRNKKQNQNKQSPLSSVYVTVHSLNLHLQAALHRTQAADEKLEKMMDAGETKLQSDMMCKLTSDLESMKRDLEACKDCWEEGMARLECLSSKTKTIKADLQKTVEEKDDVQSEAQNAISLEDPAPIILDEVFEAYTDPSELCSEEPASEYSQEEKERKIQEQREAVRLLKELRSVIAVRAADTNERERQALMRKNPNMETEPAQDINTLLQPTQQSNSCDELRNACHSKKLVKLSEENKTFVAGETCDSENEGSLSGSNHEDRCEELTALGDGQWSSSTELSDSLEAQLQHKLAGYSSGDFSFSKSVAVMAAARSQEMTNFQEETFGGEGEVEEDESE